MAGLPHEAKIFSRIIFQNQREMDLILHVLLDRLDDFDIAIKCEVLTSARFSVEFARDPFLEIDTLDGCALNLFGRIKKIFICRARIPHCAVHLHEMVSRNIFGAFENSPGLFVHVAHIGLFRVVIVFTRSVRISSISVLSKRSPALSAAIFG